MNRRAKHRLMFTLAGLAVAFTWLGYHLAPAQPWIFAHMTPGSYIAAFPTEGACRAARRAYGDRAGIPTDAPLTIAGGYVDFCSQHPDPDGAPFARIDIEPEAEPVRRDVDQKPAAVTVRKHRPAHRRRRHRNSCIVCAPKPLGEIS